MDNFGGIVDRFGVIAELWMVFLCVFEEFILQSVSKKTTHVRNWIRKEKP